MTWLILEKNKVIDTKYLTESNERVSSKYKNNERINYNLLMHLHLNHRQYSFHSLH